MKRLLFGIVIVVTLTLTYVSGQLFFAYRSLSQETDSLQGRLDSLKTDSDYLKSDLGYFRIPENLEKELRSRFNFKNPGEKLVIGVLQKDPSASSGQVPSANSLAGQAGQVPSDAATSTDR